MKENKKRRKLRRKERKSAPLIGWKDVGVLEDFGGEVKKRGARSRLRE
jgi:hypothetical protein